MSKCNSIPMSNECPLTSSAVRSNCNVEGPSDDPSYNMDCCNSNVKTEKITGQPCNLEGDPLMCVNKDSRNISCGSNIRENFGGGGHTDTPGGLGGCPTGQKLFTCPSTKSQFCAKSQDDANKDPRCPSDKKGLTTVEIIAIVVGGLLVVVLVILLIVKSNKKSGGVGVGSVGMSFSSIGSSF